MLTKYITDLKTELTMETEKKLYTLIVHSENVAGILNQITAVFTRRQINIESLNVSASSIEGVHRYTITAYATRSEIERVVLQIERKVDVLQCQFFEDSEIFMQEIALFKIITSVMMSNPEVSQIIRKYQANIIEVNPTFSVVEKSGKKDHIMDLNRELAGTGCILQFVSSGRIAITRARIEHVSEYLDKISRRYAKN